VVLSVDGARVDTWTGFAERLADRQGQTVVLSILRHGDMMNVEVRPREESGTGRIGVEQQYVYKRLPFKEAVGNAFLHTQRLAVEGLGLAWRLVRGKPGVELTGPIAVTRSVGEAAGQSEDTFLRMVVALSIALAVFNLLPVPALDGGRMLFVLVETVTGRALPVGLETLLHLLGFLLLMGLTVWVAVSDVRKWLGREPTPPPAETRPPAAAPPPPRLDGGTAPDAGR
jgi:regulator of sigma E protease